MIKLKLRKFYAATMTWLTVMECLCTDDHGYVPFVVNTFRSFPHSWHITGSATKLSRRVSLVEQELLSLTEHMSSPPDFSGDRVIRCLVLCVCFVDLCLFFFFWQLCWQSMFDLWIMITPLVSSNSSCSTSYHNYCTLLQLRKKSVWKCHHSLL